MCAGHDMDNSPPKKVAGSSKAQQVLSTLDFIMIHVGWEIDVQK